MHVQHLRLAEQRLADQLPEGADDRRLGRAGANPLHRIGGVDVLGLKQGQIELSRRRGGGRRLYASPSALPPVGRCHHQLRAVRGVGESAEDGRCEFGGAEKDRSAHAAVAASPCSASSASVVGGLYSSPSRMARSAPFRCSRGRAVEDQDAVEVIDLVLQHPCLEAGCLDQQRLAPAVEPAHSGVQRALDVHRDAGDAQAPLLCLHNVIGKPLDLGD